jgi:tetratricopeptide (TPR) repeat protein
MIFLNYRVADTGPTAARLADRLRAEFPDGVFYDARSIESGTQWPESLRAALAATRVMVSLVGRDWLKAADEYGRRRLDHPDDWVRNEIATTLGRKVPVVPLLIDGAAMPPAEALPDCLHPFATTQARTLRTRLEFEDDFRGLVDALHPHAGGLPVLSPPPAAKKPFHLRYTSLGESFIGRDALLADLRDRRAAAVQAGRWPNHALLGLGGVGKTRAAVEYALRYRDEYAAVLFAAGDTPSTLRQSFAEMLRELMPSVSVDLPEPDRAAAAVRWLGDHPGWLLVIDNVDSEEARDTVLDYLPKIPDGHVLVTGRFQAWGNDVTPLDVKELTRGHAVEFLTKTTAAHRQAEADDAREVGLLADDLGYLCLALEQAAAYIRKLGLSFREYRRRWASNQKNVRQWADRIMRYHDEQAVTPSVATTWQTTFDELSEAGKSLLWLLCWLSHDPLPRFLLGSPALEPLLRETGTDPAADAEFALAELRDYSLLRPIPGSTEFAGEVHRLVQLIGRDRQTEDEKRRRVTGLLKLVTDATPRETDDAVNWPKWKSVAEHARAATGFADDTCRGMEYVWVIERRGRYHAARAEYAEAERLFREALQRCRDLPAEPLELAYALCNMDWLLDGMNRKAEAEPYSREALALRQENLPVDHPDVATSLDNLATLLDGTCRQAEAEPLYREALAVRRKVLPAGHPDIATILNNLASLLSDTGRAREAEPLFREALAISRAALPAHHPHVAGSLNSLASLLATTGRRAEAEPLFREALSIQRGALPVGHPDIAPVLTGIAALYFSTYRFKDAKPLLQEAYEILLAVRLREGYMPDQHDNYKENFRTVLKALKYTDARIKQILKKVEDEVRAKVQGGK